jgi:tetratricopeptide (TPR) repeat protein
VFAVLAHEMAAHKERCLASSREMESLGFAHPLGEGAHVADPEYPFGIDAGRDPRLWGFGRRTRLALGGCSATELGWVKPTPSQDPSRRAFIESAFEQAVDRFPRSLYLKLCLIDFVAAGDAKAAKKRCKSFLKADRNNLVLLCRYAELEAANGSLEDALRVYETALAMGQAAVATGAASEQAQSREHLVRLCRSFATLLIEHERRDRAAAVLAACAGEPWVSVSTHGGPLSPTTVARARAVLERHISPWGGGGGGFPSAVAVSAPAASSQGGALKATTTAAAAAAAVAFDAHAGDLVACRALFEYCTVGFESAVEVCERVSQGLEARERSAMALDVERMECERMRESAAVLAHWHCATHREASGPAVLRRVLERSLRLHPSNTTLLTLFVSSEARSRIAGRVRAWFGERTRSRTCPVPVYLFAVYAELSQAHGASAHRVRATLRSCSDNPVARRCPLLWRMRLEFERARPGPAASDVARSVFYQAIQNCPGAKSIYLDGPSRVPSLFQEALDVLQEKGLHLRTPLEEIELLDAIGNQGDNDNDDDDDDGIEAEVEAVAALATAAARAAAEDATHEAAEAAHAADARQHALEMHAWVDAASSKVGDSYPR